LVGIGIMDLPSGCEIRRRLPRWLQFYIQRSLIIPVIIRVPFPAKKPSGDPDRDRHQNKTDHKTFHVGVTSFSLVIIAFLMVSGALLLECRRQPNHSVASMPLSTQSDVHPAVAK
jgi:hypothetical protein